MFDGARAFEGVTPDLDLHCAARQRFRAEAFAQAASRQETWLGLVADGMKRFDKNTPLYIRPMYWAEHGATLTGVSADPESTRWCLCLYETPMPPETAGLSITLSPFRRPTIECMPVDAKAGCLYPNNGRALAEANARGFDNCLLSDMLGNVAELATANIFFAKDGVVYTPAANGTFLCGITRHRTIKLLRDAGVTVVEGSFRYSDFESRGRDLLHRQLLQADARRAHRRSLAAARAVLSQGAQALLGLRAQLKGGSSHGRCVPCANAGEMRAALAPIWHYFGQLPPTEDAIKHFLRVLKPERMHAAFEGDAAVAGSGSFPFDLTVPGGQVKAAGVTVVGVLPTHRRRGYLRAMKRSHDRCRACARRAVAVLWATEDTIYGQFGYGMASMAAEIDVPREHARAVAQVDAPGAGAACAARRGRAADRAGL